MHPKYLSVQDFTYELPEEKIAKYPLPERDASKLLIYRQGAITNDTYSHIEQYLPPGALLVFNNTKVIAARLLFQKTTGAFIEIFCLEPQEPSTGIHAAMLQQQRARWKCLVGGASKWKPGQLLEKKMVLGNEEIILHASYVEKQPDCFVIEFSWSPTNLTFSEILHCAGSVPLPPYIKRQADQTDVERYQTIYAQHDGSVAAPTAGLHFTDTLFSRLATKNIQPAFVTLHVGAGTFKPVKGAVLEEHAMHAEFIEVTATTIQLLLNNLAGNIIPVGTTSLRTIESLYWLGVKTILQANITYHDLVVQQWDPYELPFQGISPQQALQSLLNWMEQQQTGKLITKTQLLIAPGYALTIAKALITNFHQPQSTLLLLVAAIIGDDWKKVYQYAMQHEFRFLSYGDGCLLFKGE